MKKAIETGGESLSGLGVALGEAWKLIRDGLRIDDASRFESDVSSLTAPHLAVLAHKREKSFETLELAGERRWYSELNQFVTRVLIPRLGGNSLSGFCNPAMLAELVDQLVATEQCRIAEAGRTTVPSTSRFETSWAS